MFVFPTVNIVHAGAVYIGSAKERHKDQKAKNKLGKIFILRKCSHTSYETSFKKFNYGYGSAVSIGIVIISLLIVLASRVVIQRKER